jgi:hypothetical protein|tara:strand:- start:7 stop:429 length:423 start_codon:yes stop_codon:yes gene_type:complete
MSNLIIFLLILLFTSCGKKWDPDAQFDRQTEIINIEKENYQSNLGSNAIERLKLLESEIISLVKNGLPKSNFNNLVGFEYLVLAQNINSGEQWERRIYKWEDIVESKWGTTSLEFKLSEKNKDYFIVTINERNVVNVEYL